MNFRNRMALMFPLARDAAFAALAAGLVVCTWLDINFLSREWYRGTTRGIEFSFVDILSIGLLISLGWSRRMRPYWPASLGLVVLFLCYAAGSVAGATPKLFGVFEVWNLTRAVIVFLVGAWYVRGERELTLLLWVLIALVLGESALALGQRYIAGEYRVGGTLGHPNSLSMYLLLTGPILVAALNSEVSRRMRLAAGLGIAAATVAMVLTASRMGVPAFALVMLGTTLACMDWKLTRRKVITSLAILLALAGILAKSWDILADRYKEATLQEEFEKNEFENRGSYLRLANAIVQDHFWGVGLNNWSYWVSKKYGPQLGFSYEDYDDIPEDMITSPLVFDWSYKYAPPAHNLAALTAGELGIPGLLLLAALLGRWLWLGAAFLWPRSPSPLRRVGVGLFFGFCGVILQSQTEWAFRQSSILLTCFLLAGVLASLHRLKQPSGSQAVKTATVGEQVPPPHPCDAKSAIQINRRAPLRISGFGFLSDLGFRISDFRPRRT